MRLLAVLTACLTGLAATSAVAEQTAGPPARAHYVKLGIKSGAALVIDQESGELLFGKNEDQVLPIASITKLMTAIVILDSGAPLGESVTIERADVDRYKGSRSKLAIGLELTRSDLLKLALMASENRAAAALSRTFPGGSEVFVDAMNRKARLLGMNDTRFVDATGLNPGNVSTAADLAKLVAAAHEYPLIREYTTADSARLQAVAGTRRPRVLHFVNSNRLVRSSKWQIGLSKTGYISEAGRCLVMQARIADKPLIIVLLDSWGKLTRIGDANRIKRWLETDIAQRAAMRS
ncbi:MAG TPA: D-alanyl-D-alanine endopeptidase [Burkholderiales bacterium]|jgi:D-alanyl-D-alanine endopeptidase (penicillin-binding protein 7)|nr:D-alanyl-D-alanine endopeptidase [Burkholderiales bacterium]